MAQKMGITDPFRTYLEDFYRFAVVDALFEGLRVDRFYVRVRFGNASFICTLRYWLIVHKVPYSIQY